MSTPMVDCAPEYVKQGMLEQQKIIRFDSENDDNNPLFRTFKLYTFVIKPFKNRTGRKVFFCLTSVTQQSKQLPFCCSARKVACCSLKRK